jgi:tRNA (guanine37-N1)-methyltransferase
VRQKAPIRFTVLTLFPEIIRAYASDGIIGRAVRKGVAEVEALDLRPFATAATRRWTMCPSGAAQGWCSSPIRSHAPSMMRVRRPGACC